MTIECDLMGFGPIGRRLCRRIEEDDNLELKCLLVKPQQREEAVALFGERRIFHDMDRFLQSCPQLVVEASGASGLLELAAAALPCGIDVIALSTSAFLRPENEDSLTASSKAGPGRLFVAPGAVGGLGIIRSAMEDTLDKVEVEVSNPPQIWDKIGLRPEYPHRREVLLSGSVRHVCGRIYGHLNVAVSIALAGKGLDETMIRCISDPNICQATFELKITARPGNVHIRIDGRDAPLYADPRDYTTFSVLSMLRRRYQSIVL